MYVKGPATPVWCLRSLLHKLLIDKAVEKPLKSVVTERSMHEC